MKSVQIRSFSWFLFSYIRTEYGDLRSKSPYSVRIQGNTDQKKLRIWTLFTQCCPYNLSERGHYQVKAIIVFLQNVLINLFQLYAVGEKKFQIKFCSNSVLQQQMETFSCCYLGITRIMLIWWYRICIMLGYMQANSCSSRLISVRHCVFYVCLLPQLINFVTKMKMFLGVPFCPGLWGKWEM